jgi:hypothetical protein
MFSGLGPYKVKNGLKAVLRLLNPGVSLSRAEKQGDGK